MEDLASQPTNSNLEGSSVSKTEDSIAQEVSSPDGQQPEDVIQTFPIYVLPLEGKPKIPVQVSPSDNIQDVRQFLFETPETCYMTHYQLYLDGNLINDFLEIGAIPDIKAETVLEMKPVPLDERVVRNHVRRLQELLTPPSQVVAPSVFSKFTKDLQEDALAKEAKSNGAGKKKKKGSKGKPAGEAKPAEGDAAPLKTVKGPVQLTPLGRPISLNDYYPQGFFSSTTGLEILRSLNYSGWNPPPPTRKLAGDILYIDVVTSTGQSISVTASTQGFFVNASTPTAFSPTATGKRYTSLVQLLEDTTQDFKRKFSNLVQGSFIEHPFETSPVPFPAIPWISKAPEHTYNVGRSEEFLQSQFPLDSERGQLRDWNEEYQVCKELPANTFGEKLVRDRALFRVNIDFVDAATKGALAIVNGCVTPLNPTDEPRGHMYIWNNIFFSYALDGRDMYKDNGGDRAVYVSINNDLQGIKVLNRVDIKGLHTLITAIIDYKGHRLCAQGIIPGILQREQTSTVVYGSVDNGKTIVSNEEFHKLMKEVGKELYLTEHTVVDEAGAEAVLSAPIETKGIMGTDGRRYVLDLVRITPRDANFQGKKHILTVLRPELIQSYVEHLKAGKRKEQLEEVLRKRKQEAAAQQANGDSAEQPKPSEEESTGPDEDPAIELSLNPNVMCGFKIKADPKSLETDENTLKRIASYLVDNVIPEMVNGFVYFMALPVDGATLTSVMHTRGINIRYLGRVAELSSKLPLIRDIAVREMISRGCKTLLKKHLVSIPSHDLGAFLAHFLNQFFAISKKLAAAPQMNGHARGVPKKAVKGEQKETRFASVTSDSLWEEITAIILERYQYRLESVNPELVRCVPTLRSICQKIGIQLQVKDYDFSNSPFEASNIIDFHPVVKHLSPETREGRLLLENGKLFLSQDRIDLAYELLSESLSIFHQVYGANHRDTANAYANLALVLHQAKETSLALDHQQKAVIINERVLGLDHHDTIHSYGNLGLFYHNMEESELALLYINHASYLGRLVSGLDHPDTASTFMNIAMILQDSGRISEAIEYLFAAGQCYEKILGANNAQNANINHAIASAYGQLEQYKEALEYEKKNYQVLHDTLGENHAQTVESNRCLVRWTTKAVMAKRSQINVQRVQGISPQARESIQRMSKEQSQLRNDQRETASGPIWDAPLNDVLSYLGETKPQGLRQRNQKPLITPSRKK